MDMNRRNVLIGMGGLAAAGGAVIGSGAFTSVEASRDVEVNVLTNNEIGDSDQFADVLINVGGFDTVGVDPGTGVNPDGSGLFPTSSDNYSSPSFGQGYVSLFENDVTIVFGHEQGTNSSRLLPNATTSYDNLIALVNTAGTQTEGQHSLSFGNGSFNEPNTDVSFESPPSNVQVGASTALEYNVDVTSDDNDDTANGDFLIEITSP